MKLQHLKNALLDGEYELEYPTVFHARRDIDDTLMSPSITMPSDVKCLPIRISGGALLVSAQYENKTWYAWIHAETKAFK